MVPDPVWLLLLGLLGVALLAYGIADRRGRAGVYWAWAWGLLAINGATYVTGVWHVERVASTLFPLLQLLGALRVVDKPPPRWLVPGVIALALVRGGLSWMDAHSLGAILSLSMDPPLVLAAAWLLVQRGQRGEPLRRLHGGVALGLVAVACVEALEALARMGFDAPHSSFFSWILVGVPLGALQFSLSLADARRQADVSERASRRSRQELAQSEERLLTILSSLGGTRVVVFDRHGQPQSVFGGRGGPAHVSRVAEIRLEDLLGDERGAEVRGLIREVFDTGELRETRQRVVLPEGVAWYEGSFSPIHDSSGEIAGVLAVARDVTSQVNAEEERRELEQQMQQAQKLESLGLLAGGIAHDFNNLLVGIQGNAELALQELEAGKLERTRIEALGRASESAAQLTSQLLAYAGKAAFVAQPLDPRARIAQLSSLIRTSVPATAEIRLDLADDTPWVQGDPAQIDQVVMNLIINGAEALEGGHGTVTVRSGRTWLCSDDLAALAASEGTTEGEFAWVEVCDDGSGIEPGSIDRIFDPFYSTKFQGRGLGLAAVQGIVRSHGGLIRVESGVGRGTQVRVWLPAIVPAPTSTAAVREPARTGEAGAVLVVDDDPSVRRVAGEMLSRSGFEVRLAGGGAAAISLLRQEPDAFDVVLLDLTMPEMDGEETLRGLREIRPGLPAVLMSGHSESELSERILRHERAGLLQKPFTARRLVEQVRRLAEPRDEG
ncbi:MAG: response regulator [Myxococcota bacterium]|nr:response regulator [Myxococcota bacterium]